MEFFKIFLLLLISLILVYMVVDIFENMSDFTRSQTSTLTIIQFFLLHIPQAIYYIFPLSIMFASFLNLGLFTKYNEVTAIRSAGLGVTAITFPLLIITLLISIAIFFLNESMVPAANKRAQDIKRKSDNKPEDMFFKEDSLWLKADSRTLFNVLIIDPDKEMMRQFHMYILSDDYRITESLYADDAVLENGQWVLHSGIRRIFNEDNRIMKVHRFNRYPIRFPFELNDVRHVAVQASETRFGALRNYIEKIKREGYEVKRLSVDLYAKTSFPFASFIMSIFGLTLALHMKKLGGIAAGAGFCIIVSIFYWVCFSLSLHMGYSGLLPAIISAWMTNIIFLCIGGYIFYRTTRL